MEEIDERKASVKDLYLKSGNRGASKQMKVFAGGHPFIYVLSDHK